MTTLVITGTGTEIGKTVVTAGLVRRWRRVGIDAVCLKPFQTGCRRKANGDLERPDLDRVRHVSGWCPPPETLADYCPYAFMPACSPHLAARLDGQEEPSIDRVVQAARTLVSRHDRVVAETAGGLLVPVGSRALNRDWMQALGWPVMVVARAGLGTINETLLTLESLRRAGLECVGVVVNAADAPSGTTLDQRIRDDNVATIEHHGHVPVLARIPFLRDASGALDWHRFDAAWTSTGRALLALDDVAR